MTTHVQARNAGGGAVIEVSEATFKEQVIERSRATPVVVDFWAPWCGPCRTLGPILERLAAEAKGAWVLAKLNVDNNQRLSQGFRVQGIPAVKAFRDGQVVDEFTGAIPESQVRAWLKRLVPAPSDSLVEAAAALELRQPDEAAARYRVALGSDPSNAVALLGLGRLLVLHGDPEGVETLREVPADAPQYQQAQAWIRLADFFREAGDSAPTWLAEQVAGNPGDLAARYRLAAQLVRERHYADAIGQLIAIVERSRAFHDDGARKTLLALFDALGDGDPLVGPGRRKLANVLF
ncbi:MAG: tetratricopeptide repeat protein [Kouleothrix sp.]|nr:tetratricopeptide repeat protein [Kouleothrix sp.]